jgi:hypothetical protein
MSQLGPFPRNKPSVGAMLMTQFNEFHHVNEFPRDKINQLFEVAESGFKGFDSLNHVLGSISLLLSDVPAEELLTASPNRKGSTLGVVSATYLLNNPLHGQQVRHILRSGEGVMILRIYGELDFLSEELPEFTTEINLFDNWLSYQRFVLPIVRANDLTVSKSGTMFS